MTDLRVSQVDAEVLADLPTPSLRVSEVVAEVYTTLATPSLRVSEVTAEVYSTLPTPDLRVSEVYAEVLVPVFLDANVTGRPTVAAVTTIPSPTVSDGNASVSRPTVAAVANIPAPTVTATAPPSFPSLRSWLRASDMALSDGAASSNTWADASGNGRDWGKSGTLTYETNETPTGGPVVRFNSSGGYSSPNPLFSGMTAAELWIVLRSDASDNDNPGAWRFGSNDRTYWTYTDDHIYDGAFTNTRYDFAAAAYKGVWAIVRVTHDGTTYRMFINGTLVSTHTVGFTIPSGICRLGRDTLDWRGDMAEVLVYGAALADGTDAQAVYDYLYARHIDAGSDDAEVDADTVEATTSIPSPAPFAGLTVNPATVAAIASVPGGVPSDQQPHPVTVAAHATVPAPVVRGEESPPIGTGTGTPPSSENGDVTPFDGGDTFMLQTPKSTFTLTYQPVIYSEHVTVSYRRTNGRRVWRKLRRGRDWGLQGKTLLLHMDLDQVFPGDGPWQLEAQYAYGGSDPGSGNDGTGGDGGAGGGGGGGEGDPPPDPDTPPPPTIPPPDGSILYGTSPNGTDPTRTKQQDVVHVNDIFGPLRIMRSFDAFPTTWSDTRTAKYLPAGCQIIFSMKPGLANCANGSVKERIKTFLRTIPTNIEFVGFCIHHEPENDLSVIPAGDSNTGKLFKQAWVNVLQWVDEVRAEGKAQNVWTVPILMSWSILHRNPDEWYVPGADILGWDGYIVDNIAACRDYSRTKGKPWLIAEVGGHDPASYTDSAYRNKMIELYNEWARDSDNLPVAVTYFDSTVGGNFVLEPETRPISLAWWHTLITTGAPP